MNSSLLQKWLVAIVLLGSLLIAGRSLAQELPQQFVSASTPNPVGSGARATGMGGAFIAVADDATAASWNPAGLYQLRKPEFSFALSHFTRRDDFTSRRHPEADGMQKALDRNLNYMSVAVPFQLLQRSMVLSLNYQRLYEFERSVKIDFNTRSFNKFSGSFNGFNQKVDFRQQGGLKALSPAYAVQITPAIALGITCNIWTDHLFWSNGWESDTVITGSITSAHRALLRFKSRDRERYHDFSGINFNIGFLWHMSSRITLGGVVKTPFTADIKHERRYQSTSTYPDFSRITGRPLKVREDVELEMPLSFGLGLAARVSDRLTVALDVYHTDWSNFILEDGKGRRMSPVTGAESHRTSVRDTTQVRLGLEYLLVFERTVVPLRAGVFYDPEPSENNPEDYWGFALGTGVSLGRVILDCAYQLRRGNNVAGDTLGIPQTDADVTQHRFMMSAVIHF